MTVRLYSMGGTDNVLGNIQTKQGLILSDQKMLAGKIKVDIEFETKDLQINEEAELIFDYIDEYNFKCVGITGNTYKYEVKSCINGTWQYLRTSGLVPALPKEKLHIEVDIMPSYLRLIIDGVEIFSVNIMNSIRRTSIGIWASGGRRITFIDCDIKSQLPEVFIISQFGDVYDQLYDQIQRDKCFPLPTYDLSIANRVRVTVYGKILDKNYTQLLHADTELNMRMVFLLDKVQKQEVISKESFKLLKRQGLVEGRYPNIFVSFKVADIVGQKAAYIRNRGLEDDICKQLIVKALEAMGKASKQEIMEVLENALPEVLDDGQKSKKVSNLLQAMKKEGLVAAEGKTRHAKWILQQKE